jgi:poly-gamma-glutamate capsule biosynthesis protein CapA/YwtB (metallophosphatase superfamily)
MIAKQTKNIPKYFLLVLILSLLVYNCAKKTTLLLINSSDEDSTASSHSKFPFSNFVFNKVAQKDTISDSLIHVSINLVGDLMCHKPQMNNAKKADSTYDFNPSFQFVRSHLQEADYAIGNLETTFAGEKVPFAGYPAFNSPDAFATALKNAGFDMLVTANNHSMDTQEKGMMRTLKVIKQNQLVYTGTFSSESDSKEIRMVDIKGLKLAVLNYTYGTNGSLPAKKHNYMLNIIDSTKVTNEIKYAKKNGADVVMVYYHFGIENERDVTKEQKKATEWAKKAGALIIIGAHPHVVGKTMFSVADTISNDTCFVAYSLGNFISNQYWRYTDAGVILSINLIKNKLSNRIAIKKVEYLPTWVYRGQNAKLKQHIVLPAALYESQDSVLNTFLTSELRAKMKQAYEDTKEIITKTNPRIELKTP